MRIKMIQNYGAFKKGSNYEVTDEKGITLLTRGVCVRGNHFRQKLIIQKSEKIASITHKKQQEVQNKNLQTKSDKT